MIELELIGFVFKLILLMIVTIPAAVRRVVMIDTKFVIFELDFDFDVLWKTAKDQHAWPAVKLFYLCLFVNT